MKMIKKEKLSLHKLSVKSFVTGIDSRYIATIHGGSDPVGQTVAYTNCDECGTTYSVVGPIACTTGTDTTNNTNKNCTAGGGDDSLYCGDTIKTSNTIG